MGLRLIFLFLLRCPCQGWWCGDREVEWDSGKVCDCSGEEIVFSYHKGCCTPPGPGHCDVSTEGNVRCNNSHVCYQPYKCGDTWLGRDKTCHCSEDPLSYDDYNFHYKGCCPPPGAGHCEVTSEGDVKCYNSTIHY